MIFSLQILENIDCLILNSENFVQNEDFIF
jgi:hypothetical protein